MTVGEEGIDRKENPLLSSADRDDASGDLFREWRVFNPSKIACGAGAVATAVVVIAANVSSALPTLPVAAKLPVLGDMKPNAEPVRLELPLLRSDAAAALLTVVVPEDAPMEDCKNEKPLLEDCAGAGSGGLEAVSSLDWPLIDRPPNIVVARVKVSLSEDSIMLDSLVIVYRS